MAQQHSADKDYVGFATLPTQVHRKTVKKGFDFTLLVAGESGLGKSTLINSLFLTDLYRDRTQLNAEERIERTVEICRHTLDIEEKGVKLKLTVVDTPGFADALNNTERLRPIDVAFMRALHDKVNIVLLIAKADTMTTQELAAFKQRLRDEVEEFGIKLYQFPECDSDEEEDVKQRDKELKASVPFAVVGSNTVVDALGKRVRGRLYPWGIVEVENSVHCDFTRLRSMLVQTHMQDLKDVTQDTHYENFRARHIHSMANLALQSHHREGDAAAVATDTEKLIREKDEELKRMHEMLSQMQNRIDARRGDRSVEL
ncbi:septin-5-like isoform X2 [Lampetra fluviatilis]